MQKEVFNDKTMKMMGRMVRDKEISALKKVSRESQLRRTSIGTRSAGQSALRLDRRPPLAKGTRFDLCREAQGQVATHRPA